MKSSLLLALACLALATGARAQTVTVQIMTDAAVPADFGLAYPLGQLVNGSYVYGPNFLVRVSYDTPAAASLDLKLSGSQANYDLAWRVAGTTGDNAFGGSLGPSAPLQAGSATDLYYRNDGTLNVLSSSATRYRVGARSTPAATVDLSVTVTLTVTLN